ALEKTEGLNRSDEEIRGLATLSLEKIENYQGSLNATAERIFETINELRGNIRHLHEMDREIIDNFRTSFEKSLKVLKDETKEITEILKTYKRENAYLDRKLSIINQELKKYGAIKSEELVKDLPKISLNEMRYLSFENKYRGSREDIKERQRQYVKYVAMAKEDTKGNFLLDIGCGRGEFLELMAENGIPAKGIDTNEGMVEICTNMGFDAHKGDALEFLNAVPDNSLIGITAFQVVEHLPVEYLQELIKSCFYKIKNKGIIILETVNPYSVIAMRHFWMDLSHVRPIAPETLKFLADTAGFRNIEIKSSSPVPEDLKLRGGNYNTQLLNDLLFGDQDYAVIAWK
ncbi:MAG: methyltransferase domain-containing protein, partial [Nitrospirota bacterium]